MILHAVKNFLILLLFRLLILQRQRFPKQFRRNRRAETLFHPKRQSIDPGAAHRFRRQDQQKQHEKKRPPGHASDHSVNEDL